MGGKKPQFAVLNWGYPIIRVRLASGIIGWRRRLRCRHRYHRYRRQSHHQCRQWCRHRYHLCRRRSHHQCRQWCHRYYHRYHRMSRLRYHRQYHHYWCHRMCHPKYPRQYRRQRYRRCRHSCPPKYHQRYHSCHPTAPGRCNHCPLYTSDAADDRIN